MGGELVDDCKGQLTLEGVAPVVCKLQQHNVYFNMFYLPSSST